MDIVQWTSANGIRSTIPLVVHWGSVLLFTTSCRPRLFRKKKKRFKNLEKFNTFNGILSYKAWMPPICSFTIKISSMTGVFLLILKHFFGAPVFSVTVKNCLSLLISRYILTIGHCHFIKFAKDLNKKVYIF